MNRRAAATPISCFLRVWCVAVALAVAVPFAPGARGPAMAQQAGERQSGGLLRFLFNRNQPERQERAAPRATPRQTTPRRSSTTTRRSQQPAVPAVAAVEKSPDARRVLVVGDFLAGGLAEGLAAAFAENANVLVIDRSNGSSGLVRDDHYDWPASIDEVIAAESPAVVVVMIGSNDRQQMRVEGTRESPRSDAWTAEYERRVSALVKDVREKRLPLLWVGNLPFRPSAMSSDMIAFNDIYRRIVTEAGGEFVDVWDGFVDENGAFATNGPDMNGHPAQLRSSDGINVTRQGRRKIAFYVEKPLNRLLGTTEGGTEAARLGDPFPDGTIPGPGAIDDGEMFGPERSRVAPARIDRTAPVAIDDLDSDDGSGLLGFRYPGQGEGQDAGKAPSEREPPEPRPGRADYFTMAPAASPTDPATTTALTP